LNFYRRTSHEKGAALNFWWCGREIYDICDSPMIWLSGAAHFATLNAKGNSPYGPHLPRDTSQQIG